MASNSTFKITSGVTRSEEYNLLYNPNFEDGYSNNFIAEAAGGYVSTCSDRDYVYSGRFSMRVLAETGTNGFRTTTSAYASTEEKYTLSWKTKWGGSDTPASGAMGVLLGAVSLTPVHYASIGNDWYQYWVTFDGVAGGAQLHWTQTNATVSYVDEFRLCVGSSRDYFDGDSEFSSWDGTPRNSPSTRVAKTGVEFEFANVDSRQHGFFLDGITPGIASYRGGGIYNQSVFGDGRMLVDTQYDNVIEAIGLKLVASSQDDLARKLQDLRRLLIKAKDFWVNRFATEPVWIEARSSTETNIRYAVIYNAQMVSDSDMWRPPFLQSCSSFMDNLTLTIERGHWQDARPGVRSDVDISNETVYATNGLTYGMEANREAFILNGRQTSNISHIFKWDEGDTAFSANMVGAALPWNWFDLPCETGDAIYFGIESSDTDAARFNNLVFDLGLPSKLNDSGSEWQQYYTGAWNTLATTVDGTADGGGKELRRVGPAIMSFVLNSAVAPTAVNGVTAYWIRYYVTTALPATESPTQQNRLVYTATQPYIEIAADEIGGDVDAPAKISVTPQYNGINRVMCAARSVSRGSNFTPVINLAQTNNPDGITVTVPGALTTFSSAGAGLAYDTAGAAGECAFYNIPTGAQSGWLEQVKVAIAAPLAREYSGRFRLILRFLGYAYFGGGYVDCDFTIGAQVTNGSGGVAVGQPSRFDYVHSGLRATSIAADLGVFDVSQFDESDEIDISLYVSSDGTGFLELYMYDLWMMPVDEFVVDSRDLRNASATASEAPQRTGSLVIDGTSLKRVNSYAMDNSRVMARYNTSSSARPFIKPNNNVRLYFMNFWMGNYNLFESDWKYAASVTIEKIQRYLSMRGDR